ncbi:hypothetical protein [Aminobacter sp. MSH1]|uniref:hypothetical protein n=1 Tax=Aminobacter sp. MSH1 TaxID=374606 RepID=UPI000D33F193|nr:hypothetical protein [Aminobacter sp. MSH1]
MTDKPATTAMTEKEIVENAAYWLNHTDPDAALHPLEKAAIAVHKLDILLRDATVAAALGTGLVTEFRYPVAAFRVRFGRFMPEAQQDLFSAPR